MIHIVLLLLGRSLFLFESRFLLVDGLEAFSDVVEASLGVMVAHDVHIVVGHCLFKVLLLDAFKRQRTL